MSATTQDSLTSAITGAVTNATTRQRLHAGHERRALVRRLEDRTLCTLFTRLPRHLPQGRKGLAFESIFAKAARRASVRVAKLCDVRDLLADVMDRAIATNDEGKITATQLEIDALLAELRAQAFAKVPDRTVKTFTRAAVSATKETAEALAKIAEAGATRCPSAIAEAHREADEAIVSLTDFKASAARGVRMSGRQPANAS